MIRLFHHLLLLLFLLFAVARCEDSSSNFFEKADLCDVFERIDRKCSKTMPTARSFVDCVTLCSLDKSCIGASLDENDLCYHHEECPMISEECAIQNAEHTYKKKYCAHGSWNTSSQKCECVDGFFGQRCKQCHAKCRDLRDAGYPWGDHKVYLDPDDHGERPFPVVCSLHDDDYSITALINHGGVGEFNRSWADYVNGFHDNEKHLWLGLYAWHRLSQGSCKNAVFLFRLTSRSGSPDMYRIYDDFKVSGEDDGFRFTSKLQSNSFNGVTLAPGTQFGDCMSVLQNVPFSTWNKDNDEDVDENCAARAEFGWWFSGCANTCNILGSGLQSWGQKPSYQLFSLVGFNMSLFETDLGFFFTYLRC